jgi:hypothetical protein
MISFFKGIFDKKNKVIDVDEDKIDSIKDKMVLQLSDTKTPTLTYPKGFDPEKATIIILDDSAGATLLFDDTIRELQADTSTCASDIQFIKISTPQAVFMLDNEINSGHLKNIVGAVLDITIGGYAIIDNKTVILDGVDAYKMIKEKFPEAAMRFFTSHSMNEKNAEIYRFMKKYADMTGENIKDKTYIKNPFSTNRIDMMKDILGEICDA